MTKEYRLSVLVNIFLLISYFSYLTFGIRVFPHSSHNPFTVDIPIVAIVNNPTHLQLTVKPKPSPVMNNQTYHQN